MFGEPCEGKLFEKEDADSVLFHKALRILLYCPVTD